METVTTHLSPLQLHGKYINALTGEERYLCKKGNTQFVIKKFGLAKDAKFYIKFCDTPFATQLKDWKTKEKVVANHSDLNYAAIVLKRMELWILDRYQLQSVKIHKDCVKTVLQGKVDVIIKSKADYVSIKVLSPGFSAKDLLNHST